MKEFNQKIQAAILELYGHRFGFINDIKALKKVVYGNYLNKEIANGISLYINIVQLEKSGIINYDFINVVNPKLIHRAVKALADFIPLAYNNLTAPERIIYQNAFTIANLITQLHYKEEVRLKVLKF